MGQLVPQRLRDAEAEALCRAARHERSAERVIRRNSYREPELETRLGTWSCGYRSCRTGSYLPSVLEPRKASEQALVAVVEDAYVKGISKSQVSLLCAELDERVETFLNRPLTGAWPYLWLDAT